MIDIYVYDKSGDDTSTTGLVGSLLPISCEHEEIGNGMSAVTLVHPYDEGEKWKALQNGNILSVPVRVRTVPAINANGTYITSVEKWSVKQGLTKAQRKIFANEKKNKKKGMLNSDWEVYVLGVGESRNNEERYNIKYPKKNKKGVIKKWLTGWVIQEALDVKIEDVDISTGGIETICPSGESVPQLFRIQSVEYDVDSKQITVYAVHISYDLSSMVTVYKNDTVLNANTALNGIMDGIEQDCDFSAYTDSANERTSCDWVDTSPMAALLDPEDGFAEKWGTELVRDDYDLYFLGNGGTNRGIRIEHAKNMTGANMEVNWEELVTVIKPVGVTKKGNPLYLVTDGDDEDADTFNAGNYISSPNVETYGERVQAIECDDCTVEKGKKGVTLAIARQRMRTQAEAKFEGDDRVDTPKITMTVNFQELGQTVEYEAYKPLENVYLWDSVVVAAKAFGIEATAKVTRIQLDVLTNRVIEVELGDIKRSSKIYSWQLPSLAEHNMKAAMLNNETPVVQLSGSELVVTADQNGLCAATSAAFSISAWAGYEPIDPEIDAITGVPSGMTITPERIVNAGTIPLTVSVAAGATLGNEEQCSGQIVINILNPIEKELIISWAKICKGENGEDGRIREFVYKLTDTKSPPTIDQTTGHSSPDYVPSGWSDNPNGISSEHKYEWQSYRDKKSGLWTAFSDPALWSVWGEKGADGDGIEYIYKLTSANSAPTVPSPLSQTSGHIPSGWTNNPTGVSSSYMYEWVSMRKKTAGVWGSFTSPGALWAKYGATGPQGPQGPSGPTGLTGPRGPQGLPGANGSVVYYYSSAPGYYSDPGNDGDLWYVMDGTSVTGIYRHSGGWSKVEYDYGTIAIGNVIAGGITAGTITADTLNALKLSAYSFKKPNGVTGISFGNWDDSNQYNIFADCVAFLPVFHAMQDLGGTTDTLGTTEGYRWKGLYLSGTVHANSDRALKKDIEPCPSGLLERLNPVKYRMKSEPNIQRYGFVAQDVRDALNEMNVSEVALVSGKDGDMDMAYTELIAPLVEGWQNHEKRISKLEADNADLRSRIYELERMVMGEGDDGK